MLKLGERQNGRAITRRGALLAAGAGLLAPSVLSTSSRANARTLVWAHNVPPPETSSVAFAWMADEVNKRSNGALNIEYRAGTLLTQEMEIVNAVRAGNVAIGSALGAAPTIVPELSVLILPYIIKSYEHADRVLNGPIGEFVDRKFQETLGVKVLFYYDIGFRHFWNTRRAINVPADLRGLKLRAQPAKIWADSINGLGANAVSMPYGELFTAAQQGVVDGADLPIVNFPTLRVHEIAKYCSFTKHNYSLSVMLINLAVWKELSADEQKLLLEIGKEAQARVRNPSASVDSVRAAKELLETKGMLVSEPDLAAFQKVAEERIWPAYKRQFPEMWDRISGSI